LDAFLPLGAAVILSVVAGCGSTRASGPQGASDGSVDGDGVDASNSDADGTPEAGYACPGEDGGPTLVVAGPTGAGRIALDDAGTYWAAVQPSVGTQVSFQGQVLRCGRCDCQSPITIYSGTEPDDVAVRGSQLYWLDGDVMTAPVDGGSPSVLVTTQARSLAVDDVSLYWTDTTSVLSVPMSGGTPAQLASSQINPGAIAVDDTYVYWADISTGDIQRVPKQGTGAAPTTLSTGAHAAGLASDGVTLFWLDVPPSLKNSAVMSVPIAGGTASTVASGFDGGITLALDGVYVYWTCRAGVLRAPKSGGTATTLVSSQPTQNLYGLALGASGMYWTESLSGNVMREDLP
jgi:hypothetical protein